MRTPIIAGNWKMNKTPAEATQLIPVSYTHLMHTRAILW